MRFARGPFCCGYPTGFRYRRNSAWGAVMAQDEKGAGTYWFPRL
jgi:hypothetical protein